MAALRQMVQETFLHPQQLVAPFFVVEGKKECQPIASMPEVYRYSIDLLLKEVEELYALGVRSIELFPVIDQNLKDPYGEEGVKPNNLLSRAVKAIKKEIPEICVMVDIALDPYTDHGHDGIVDDKGYVLNDETLAQLNLMSTMLADAGADVVAPSDMMDGRIGAIRKTLDLHGFYNVNILSYAAKYASSLYGPFREALFSTPKFGNKKSYQLNPANVREALIELALDEEEGADMLLVKPAYLDIITKAREVTHLPLGAYHVSGEYAMVMAAGLNGWIDTNSVLLEALMSIKRAGADFILTYAAKRVAQLLGKGL